MQGQENNLVHKLVMTQRLESLPGDATLMTFWLSFLQALARRFVSFGGARIFWSASVGSATGWPALKVWILTKHG